MSSVCRDAHVPGLSPRRAPLALEFLARVVTHIPDPGQVVRRYYGWFASRADPARGPQALRAAPASGPGEASLTIPEPPGTFGG